MQHQEQKTGEGFIATCAAIRRTLKRAQVPTSLRSSPSIQLPADWCWATLSEVCERVSVGHVGPTSEFFCEPGEGVRFVRSQNVRPGLLEIADCAWVTTEFHRKLKKSQLQPGDILVVRVGANRGDVCSVPDGLDELNCANIVFARPIRPSDFFVFYLRSDHGRASLLGLTTGSAQGVLNTKSVANLPIPVPPPPTQKRIASILSAYDDLIENNTKRIKILEEMARALYREWFVHFRFPGHEEVELIDSPMGMIPEGWEVVTLGELTDVVTKGTTPTSVGHKFTDDGINFVKVESVQEDGTLRNDKFAHIDQAGHDKLKRSQLQVGDILFSIAGAIGRCTMVPHRILPANTNQALAIIRVTDELHRLFLYRTIRAPDFQNFSLGRVVQTAQANVSLGVLKSAPVLLPERAQIAHYQHRVASMEELSAILRQKNELLRQTRDLLLPKLISGEIDVDALDLPEVH